VLKTFLIDPGFRELFKI